MRMINKYFNKLQLIGIILSTLVVLFIPILNNDILVPLGWCCISLQLFGHFIFLKKWSKDGITWIRKADKNYKNNLTRRYTDISFYIVLILGIIMCIVSLFDKLFKNNYLALLITYFISIIVSALLFYITDKTNKQIMEILPKKK